ncbi:MAG TPA: hypothetical protein VEQ65_05185 [Opitutus sp.]|nr:hypothetical protein [Opitutus sp.]
MKQNTQLKQFIFAAAVSLGVISTAVAQSANVAVPTPTEVAPSGLLGARYTEVAYKFVDLKGDDDAHGFTVAFNQPLAAGFDLVASYDWVTADFGPFDAKVQDAEIGVKAFSQLSWAKPYVQAAVGWEWQKVASFREDSFFWKVGAGAEFQVAPAFVVTPFVNFVRATEFHSSEIELGAKATYRLTEAWSLTARAQYEEVRHDANTTEYAIGAIYRF